MQEAELTCISCSTSFPPPSLNKDLPVCPTCFTNSLEVYRASITFKPADHILDNVYLGPEGAAIDLDYLKANKIDRIVVAAHHTEARFPLDLEYLKLDIDDSPTEDLMPHFGPVLAFIQKNPHTNVLIHCASGISRSATFVIAYVMKAGGMEYEKAREFVASKRPCVHPNSGFQKQLERLGEMFNMMMK
ncbi:hypothetical protein FGO68_gene1850 [Halteria grandinella]|uniref:protein-tyrosine-phosphatase n=1 Tax=Halteria grandinella TaxID=5974 RepID=A0A8J8SYZ4_HALGN|nr:hypothetical protein FGO68_gene1850 [Halteria grandinella]